MRREYAEEQLIAALEQAPTSRAHAQFYLSVVEQAGSQPGAPRSVEWLDAIDRQLPNIRVALRYLLGNGCEQSALRMANGLEQFWWARGDLVEGCDWLRQCLELGQRQSRRRARAYGVAAVLLALRLELDEAERLAGIGLPIAQVLGDQIAVADLGDALGLVAGARGRPDDGERAFAESIGIRRQAGDTARLARTLEFSADGRLWDGDLPASAERAEAAVQVLRARPDPVQLATALTTLGLVHTYQSRLDEALEELQSGLDMAVRLRSSRLIGRAHYGFGLLAQRSGDVRVAESQLATAIAIVAETGDRSFLAGCVLALATVYESERPDEAVLLLAAATAQAKDGGLKSPGLLRAPYEQLLASLRQRLGAQRFGIAWSRGSRIARNDVLRAPPPQATEGSAADAALTKREIQVLALVARGLTDAQIADNLTVSRRTVHAHLRAIYRKLQLHTRSAATRYAVERGLR